MNRQESLQEWQRRVALDIAQAYPLTPNAPIKATGQHRVAENDEPEPALFTEEELQQADLARNERKAQRRVEQDVRVGIEQQAQMWRDNGGM